MNRKILGLTLALGLAAGCEFAEKTTYDGPIEQCRPTVTATGGSSACTENAECCSYGCVAGVCAPGDHVGSVCATTNDCGLPDVAPYTQMTCKSGTCVATTAGLRRDDGDVCSAPSQCVSNHCNGGLCVPNNAPVVQLGDTIKTVPRNQPFPFTFNASYDPDTGDTLSFGWTILPAGSWTLDRTNPRYPVFNPGSATATYTLYVDVTDNWGLTSSGSVLLNVVNTPPVVTPAAATATTLRNVALDVPMTVSDANGDPLDCTWSICRAGTATCLTAPAPLTAIAGLPSSVRTAAFPSGLTGTQEGDWDVALTCTDPYTLSATGTTTVTVTNSAPVVTTPLGAPAVQNPARTYNLAYAAGATPEKLVTASASDANGDSVVSWSWSVSPTTGVTLTNANGPTVGFTPTAPGTYTLTATACDVEARNAPWVDRVGDCGSTAVVATVHPYIRPLTDGSVAAAAWRKSDDRLVAVGTTAVGSNALWLVNPAIAAGTASATLGAIPAVLSLSVDEMTALVGQQANRYQTVALGAPPTSSTPVASALHNGPFQPDGIVHFNTNRGYAFKTGVTPGAYDLDLSAAPGAPVAATCTNCTLAGKRPVTDGTTLWVLAPGTTSGTLTSYSVNNGNGAVTRILSGTVSSGATDLWRSSDPGYLFMPGTNGIVSVDTFNSAGSLPAGSTHADSSLTAAALVGLAATGATVTPFDSSFAAGSPIALPRWGATDGADRTLTSRWVFLSASGTRAHVVVQSSAPAEWGLYSCDLPCALP